MSPKQKCGHKAGPNCIICNDPNKFGDLQIAQHVALVYKLMDLAPYISSLGRMEPTGYAASSLFVDALGVPSDPEADPATVNRLCKLVICAANIAGEMFQLTSPRNEWTFEAPPGWNPQQLLAARMAVAAANNDALMVAEHLVSGISGIEPMEQLDRLCEVLFHHIMAAARARQLVASRNGAAPIK